MRSELGKFSLDKIFWKQKSLNANIVDAINQIPDSRLLSVLYVPPGVNEFVWM